MRFTLTAHRTNALASLLAVLLAAMLSAASPASAFSSDTGEQVKVAGGTLRGKISSDQRGFLGVPYAAPPLENLRFRPPQALLPWSGVRDATKAGNMCPQSALSGVGEDCLLLNVHTPPVAESENLPVMVWFHGGGFQSGAGSVYDPTPLVTKGKVIVVTVNYRLGAFGYLALPGLTSEPGAQSIGNVGFLDQQASLRWVHDNIGVFGGNAGNVTIFGQSAGAHSTCMHMIAPSSAGLFQKAISESGGCIETPIGPGTVAKAYDKGERFATAVGCTDPATVVSCLRGKPYADLVKASGSPLENGDTWFPTLDGKVITQTPRAALTSGKYNHVPLILGSNKDEGRLFVALTYHLLKGRPSTAAELVEGIKTLKADASQELIDGYHPASSSNADLALARVFTDGIFACPDLRLAKAVTSQPAPAVYHYEFADPDPQGSYLDLSMKLGDFHGSELPYLFDMVQGMTTSQKSLSDQMVKYWTTFAKTGNPNGSGTPVWPAFTAGSEQAQRLTSEGTRPISTFSAEHRCRLWG